MTYSHKFETHRTDRIRMLKSLLVSALLILGGMMVYVDSHKDSQPKAFASADDRPAVNPAAEEENLPPNPDLQPAAMVRIPIRDDPAPPTASEPQPRSQAQPAPSNSPANKGAIRSVSVAQMDKSRKEVVESLRDHGVEVDWQHLPLTELFDIESRVKKAAALNKQYGWNLDWKKNTYAQMYDYECRINRAQILREKFKWDIDWRKYSLDQMYGFERRAELGLVLQKLGVSVDWSKYSEQQLLDMKRDAEMNSR